MNKQDFINLQESIYKIILNEEVTEDWFSHSDTFSTSKKGIPIKHETATEAGTTETLEGPVGHERGHKIITGPKGEKYPVAPEKFAQLYDDNGDGSATPKAIPKTARIADHDGIIKTSWGDLNYEKGKHYIVRHGAGDYGVVAHDIFHKTYNAPTPEEPQAKVIKDSAAAYADRRDKHLANGTYES